MIFIVIALFISFWTWFHNILHNVCINALVLLLPIRTEIYQNIPSLSISYVFIYQRVL
jgi:hypothetical protein